MVVKYLPNKYGDPSSSPPNLYACCKLDPFITAVRISKKIGLQEERLIVLMGLDLSVKSCLYPWIWSYDEAKASISMEYLAEGIYLMFSKNETGRQ